MAERLQKLIAQAGMASRRQAEDWIAEGRVSVNGHVAVVGEKADPTRDVIEVDGRQILGTEKKITILLNKPRGYISTLSDPQGRRLVTDLIADIPERLYPVGRLDFNTEGLLLLTNDGELSLRLTHPRHHVSKTYLVKVQGTLSSAMAARLSRGVVIDGYKTAPAKVDHIRSAGTSCWFELTIREGKNRQVRKMCESVGLSVVRLKRIRIDFLDLGDLAIGKYRFLSEPEIQRLKQ